MVVMRIPCPSCSAIYEVPDDLLVVVRKVRCASCGHEWLTTEAEPRAAPEPLPPEFPVEAPEEVPEEIPAGAAEPINLPLSPPARTGPMQRLLPALRENRVVLLGWVVSVLLLVLMGRAAILHRDGIMAAWPPSQRLFVLLGLPGGR